MFPDHPSLKKLAAGKLSPSDEARAKEILAVMQAVQRDVGFPVDWGQVAVIKPKLEQRVMEFREAKNPTPVYVYVVRLSAFAYFQCIRGGHAITTPSPDKALMTESRETAQQVIEALQKKFQIKAAYDHFTNTIRRRQNTMVTDLASTGFNE